MNNAYVKKNKKKIFARNKCVVWVTFLMSFIVCCTIDGLFVITYD